MLYRSEDHECCNCAVDCCWCADKRKGEEHDEPRTGIRPDCPLPLQTPTQWAYDQACKALNAHKERIATLERERDEARARLERTIKELPPAEGF